jgi:hypothetical protein
MLTVFPVPWGSGSIRIGVVAASPTDVIWVVDGRIEWAPCT